MFDSAGPVSSKPIEQFPLSDQRTSRLHHVVQLRVGHWQDAVTRLNILHHRQESDELYPLTTCINCCCRPACPKPTPAAWLCMAHAAAVWSAIGGVQLRGTLRHMHG
jgi:hypothetical protein